MINQAQSFSTTKNNLQVMVVDDDEFQLEFTSDLLKDMNIKTVSIAASGEDALAKFNRAVRKPDLLICDLHMPGMDGFDFMAHLSKQKFSGALIIVSGQKKHVRHSAGLVAQLGSCKFLGELEKPINKIQLESLIRKI